MSDSSRTHEFEIYNRSSRIGIVGGQYLITSICIISFLYPIYLIDWPNTRELLIAISSLSIFVGLLTAVAFLVFFHFKKNTMFLIISLTTAGATAFAVYDLVPHIYASNTLSANHANLSDKYHYNNHFTHLFLSVMLGFGYCQRQYMSRINPHNLKIIIIISACLFFLVSFLGQLLIQNPSNHQMAETLGNFLQYTTLLILAGTLVGFLVKKTNGPATIEFWLVFFVALTLYIHMPSVDKVSITPTLSPAQVGFYTIGTYLILLSGLIYNSLWIISRETATVKVLTQRNEAIELLYVGGLIISETNDFKTATSQCLERLAHFGKWDLGHACFIDNNNDNFEHYWCGDKHTECENFKDITQRLGIEYGVGFSGKIWEEKKFLKIDNIQHVKDFLRKGHALEVGLVSAIAFPVIYEKKLVAIMELYSTEKQNIDEGFISTIGSLCRQLEILYAKERRVANLEAHERLLQELFDAFPAAIATFNQNDQLTVYNQKFAKLSALCGLDFLDDIEFSDWATVAAYSGQMEEAFGREQEWIDERLIMHKKGFRNQDKKLTNGKSIRIDDIALKTSGTVSIWSDVTELKEHETKSQSLHEILAATLTCFSDGVCIFDAKMSVVAHNNSLIELLDLPVEKIAEGTSFNDFLDIFRQNQNRFNNVITQISSLLAKITTTKTPQINHNVSLDEKTMMLRAIPLKSGGFILNIAEVTATQTHVRELMAEQELIKLSNDAKSELLEIISHDLRTPMNGILSGIDLLGNENLKDGQLDHATTIKNSAHSLMQVLNDNIELMKIDTGNSALDIAPACISEMLHQLKNACSYQAAKKNLDLSISRNSDLPDIIACDIDKILRILTHLLKNSIQNTSSGTIALTLDPIETRDDGHMVIRFKISDTGQGFIDIQREILTHEKSPTDMPSDRAVSGYFTGLKLATHLVELMGGNMSIDERGLEGTSLHFDLTLKISNWNDFKEKNSNDFSSSNGEFEGPPLCVLVAEDHPINQAIVEQLLKSWGNEVDIVENGEQAVAAVATCKYDLVLMDIQMPEMDGYTATTEIRKLPGRVRNIPVIALTASAMYGERKRCLDSGMDEYLPKPIEKKKLAHFLNKYSREKFTEQTQTEPGNIHLNPTPTMDQHSSSSLDLEALQKLNETLGQAVVENLAQRMLSQYDEQRKRITKYMQNEEWSEIHREAQDIQSCFAQFGLQNASSEAAKVDVFCRQRNYSKIIETTPDMLDRCDDAIAELKTQFHKN